MERKGASGSQKAASKVTRSLHKQTIPICLAYVVFGIAYILGSDKLVDQLALSQSQLTWLQSYKGIGFILVTGAALYGLIYGALRRRWKADVSLKASEELRRSIADHATIGVIQWDENGECTYVNPAHYDLTGHTAARTLGDGWEVAFVAFSPPMSKADLLKRMAASSRWECDVEIRHQTEGTRTARFNAVVVTSDGEKRTCVATLTDVTWFMTMKSELEARVMARTRDLQLANDNLAAFASSAAHDLRSPLRSISGFTNIIADEFGDDASEDSKDAIQRIQRNVAKMGQLISDLLALSQVDSIAIEQSRIDLTGMARTIWEAESVGLAPRIEFHAQDGLIATGDPKFVQILMQNLISNAIKFTAGREGARIDLGRIDDYREAFYIRDNGVGFRPEDKEAIFKPFERSVAHRNIPGTGVGLFTVQRIVNRHGGWIEASGSEGVGAEFRFSLRPKS